MIKKMYKKYIYKARLQNAFIVSGLFLEFKKGETTIKRFPSIAAVHETKEYIEYIFYLPQGLDPAEVEKRDYVFGQTFGEFYDLTASGRKYSLKVFENVNQEIKLFDPAVIEETLSKHGLPIIAGYDLFNNLISYNMVVDPHLLIAGETGSGKSVMLRVILTSLLLFKRDQIDFYLADMKRTEFHIFRNCEGVKAVITDKKKLALYLKYVHAQLEIRGNMLDAAGVDHVDEYNKIKDVEKLKYIMFCIDEVALLRKLPALLEMVEDIATQGRALGIYTILSMQRPDAKVLDGQLKASLTVRYAFRHVDKINSNITLGSGTDADASKIRKNEKGKFYMRHEAIHLLQAPFLELEEAKRLLEPLKQPPSSIDATLEKLEMLEEGIISFEDMEGEEDE